MSDTTPSRSPPPQRAPSSPSIHGASDLVLPHDLAAQPSGAIKQAQHIVQSAWDSSSSKSRTELSRAFGENAEVIGTLLNVRPPLPPGLLIGIMQTLHTLIRLTPRPALNDAAGDLVSGICALAEHLHALGAEWKSARSGLMLIAINLGRASDATFLRSAALRRWLSATLRTAAKALSRQTATAEEWLASDAFKLVILLLDRHDRSGGAFVTSGLQAAATAFLNSPDAARHLDATELRHLKRVSTLDTLFVDEYDHGGDDDPPSLDATQTTVDDATEGTTAPEMEPPREGDTFTRQQVRDFLAAMVSHYRDEYRLMQQQRQHELQHVARLEEQLAEIASVTAILKQPQQS